VSQNDLFASTQISLQGFGELGYYPGWLDAGLADHYFSQLLNDLRWEQPDIYLYGQMRKIPRQQVWFGDPHAEMSYSGRRFKPRPWPTLLTQIKARIEGEFGHSYNSVLVNRYRDGNDSVSWHADDEKELGVEPVIASLSLGATRRFSLRPKSEQLPNAAIAPVHMDLHHGDLVIMGAGVQTFWHHALLKDKHVSAPRLNLTFRYICP